MKLALIPFLLVLAFEGAKAEQFEFQVHRFCHIRINTDRGKENVLIEVYPKAVPETKVILKSVLKLEDGVYKSADGICFRLLKLAHPVVNDPNRHINSGDWILLISGEGKSFLGFKGRMPEGTFREGFSDLAYLGEKVEAEE
ncbi:MAG: hypothetical protein V4819_02640 [Verrucomicrobiota bacterium]